MRPQPAQHGVGGSGGPGRPAADALRADAQGPPETDVVTANSAADVVVYRERAYQPLCPRDLIGEAVENTYRQMVEGDSFTPHTRKDVRFDEVPRDT
jgi:hypothetical protein